MLVRPDGGDRELQSALAAALGALRRRERTVAEMRRWLRERGLAEGVVDGAIAELLELGELGDERFAAAFAADKRELAGWGAERISAALLQRGLGRALVERACAEERESELQRAAEQLRGRSVALDGESARSRALSFLTRRGFEYELAYDAIRLVERELGRAA